MKPTPTNPEETNRKILEQLMITFSRARWKTLEDPFTKMVTIKCCKEEPEIPQAVFMFIKSCNPLNPEDQKYARQTLEYAAKHKCWNPFVSKGFSGLWFIANDSICQVCLKSPGVTIPAHLTLHVCKTNEWAMSTPNQKPTIRWHQQAQCWVFNYGWHNKVEEYLAGLQTSDVSYDGKHEVWLISDAICPKVFPQLHHWMPDTVWLKQTKKTIPARAQISTQALFAETILSLLPQSELKTLTRKTFMALHPDKGGDKETFIKFKLALEGWEKGRQS